MSSIEVNNQNQAKQSPKFNLQINQKGEIKLDSEIEPQPENLQAILDVSQLQNKAYFEQEREKEQLLYIAIASIFTFLVLLTVTFTFVSSIKSNYKTSEVNYVRRYVS